ncbi:hypothetical protein [Nocardia sp. NPDC006630]|uniref:hypothetical protein n=1 Tax=Nocardia sp. NPDC006630 TaxID=3157181 RepID=UPI0033AD9292
MCRTLAWSWRCFTRARPPQLYTPMPYGLAGKGVLAPGYDADIALADPNSQ